MHTIGRHRQRFCIIFGSKRLTLHLGIGPERSLQSFLAIRCRTLHCHVTLHHLVVSQVAALGIEQLLRFSLDTVKDGHSRIGRTIIVTPHHGLVIGIRTNDGNFLLFTERQNVVVVLQQHNALACHV